MEMLAKQDTTNEQPDHGIARWNLIAVALIKDDRVCRLSLSPGNSQLFTTRRGFIFFGFPR
jgi:hypothetical protein